MTFRNRLPTACYSHTPLKILHDPTTRSELTKQDPAKASALRVLGPAFNFVDRRAWRRFGHAFANSLETKGRLERAGLRPAGTVEVLHPGVDPARFRRPGTAREAMFLVAGRIMWQKRIELAIEALTLARRDGLAAELVIAGTVDAKSSGYLAQLRDHAAGLPVRFVIDPLDDELAALYNRALALVFTPPNEDWGIVPLEAMACGTPVLAVDSGGPRESVIHGETGWLLPADASSFAAAMREVAAGGAAVDAMRAAARRRAEHFGWDAFARRIDVVMEALAAHAPVPPP
jgi:glycosyltransferase involved in cell wall biosynthesis